MLPESFLVYLLDPTSVPEGHGYTDSWDSDVLSDSAYGHICIGRASHLIVTNPIAAQLFDVYRSVGSLIGRPVDFVPRYEPLVKYRVYIYVGVFRGECSSWGRFRSDLYHLWGIVRGAKMDINYFAPVSAGLLAEGGHIGRKLGKRGMKESRQDKGRRAPSLVRLA